MIRPRFLAPASSPPLPRPRFLASITSLVIAGPLLQPAASWSAEPKEATAAPNKTGTEKGEAEFAKKNYQEAFAHLQKACESLSSVPRTDEARKAAAEALARTGHDLAMHLVTEGYFRDASEVARRVLRHSPDDKDTLKLLENLEAPDVSRRGPPEFLTSAEETKAELLETENFLRARRYDRALRKMEEILRKDQDNVAAQKPRTEIQESKGQTNHPGLITRSFIGTEQPEAPRPAAPTKEAIQRKLEEIKIPRVDLREASLREAVEYLQARSKALDPDGVGVNIELRLNPVDGAPENPDLAKTKITLQLNDVPLLQAIRYVTTIANVIYRITPTGVVIKPIPIGIEHSAIKEWKVPAEVAAKIPLDQNGLHNVRDFFTARGATFPPGTWVMFSRTTSSVLAKGEPEQLDEIEKIIQSLAITPKNNIPQK